MTPGSKGGNLMAQHMLASFVGQGTNRHPTCSSPYSFCKQSTRKYHKVASEFLISLCNPTVGCNSYEKLCNGHIGRLQYFSWGSAMMDTRMVGPPADPH